MLRRWRSHARPRNSAFHDLSRTAVLVLVGSTQPADARSVIIHGYALPVTDHTDLGAQEAWQLFVGRVPPLGPVLRVALPDRWVRIHALPSPGRVAVTDEQQRIARERHLAVSGAALGPSAACAAYLTERLVRVWLDLSFRRADGAEPPRLGMGLAAQPRIMLSLRRRPSA